MSGSYNYKLWIKLKKQLSEDTGEQPKQAKSWGEIAFGRKEAGLWGKVVIFKVSSMKVGPCLCQANKTPIEKSRVFLAWRTRTDFGATTATEKWGGNSGKERATEREPQILCINFAPVSDPQTIHAHDRL